MLIEEGVRVAVRWGMYHGAPHKRARALHLRSID